jgi:DNA-binding response OmpR family regulator
LTQRVNFGPLTDVRVLVVVAEPSSTAGDPDSAASILVELGCRVTTCRFDLGDLDEEAITARPPTLVVIDAGDELARAVQARRKLDQMAAVAETPTLLVVTVPRLPALDFSLGFDDFILRPIVPAELYGRLRQLDWKSAAFGSDEVIKVGDLVIDLAGYECSLGGRRLDLTHQEFELLRFLAQNRGRVFTRDQLLQKVWGYEYTGGTRTVDIHVRRLRAKLGPVQSGIIATIRHVGYKMKAQKA